VWSANGDEHGILDPVVVALKEVLFMAVTTQARPESRATTTKKWVYLFEEGNDGGSSDEIAVRQGRLQ
jgi:hypothetical protein